MVGARPTRAILRQASQELLKPIIERRVSVAAEVFREAATLMGQLNIQLLKLPVSFSLTGGKDGSIDGKKLLGDGRLGGLTWKTDARDNNEDGILFAIDKGAAEEESILFGIADGMGGHAAGEVASEEILLNIAASFDDNAAGFDLPAAAVAANDAFIALKASRAELAGAGATLAAALIKSDKAQIIHAGDTRFYRLRARTGSKLEILTCDDNLAGVIIRKVDQKAFPLAGEEARAYYEEINTGSKKKNIVTRSVGMEKLKKEHFSPIPVELEEGDLLIGASDGLNFLPWNYLEEMIVANRDKAPVEIAEALKAALAGLTGDNVTVGGYRHGKPPAAENAPEPPTDKKVKGVADEPTTTIWNASPDVKAAFIEEATRVLELPAELHDRFAQLLEENVEFREMAMRDAKLALERTEERDAAREEVRRVLARVKKLEAANLRLQASLAKRPSASMTAVIDMGSNVKQLLAEWQKIKSALDANFESSVFAAADKKLAGQLAGKYQATIDQATAAIDARLRAEDAAYAARKLEFLEPIELGITMTEGLLPTARTPQIEQMIRASITEQQREAAGMEKELAEEHHKLEAGLEAEKDASPFPRLRSYAAEKQARVKEAEAILTQLAGERAALEERLASLNDRLSSLKATAAETAGAVSALAGQIARRGQLDLTFKSK